MARKLSKLERHEYLYYKNQREEKNINILAIDNIPVYNLKHRFNHMSICIKHGLKIVINAFYSFRYMHQLYVIYNNDIIHDENFAAGEAGLLTEKTNNRILELYTYFYLIKFKDNERD